MPISKIHYKSLTVTIALPNYGVASSDGTITTTLGGGYGSLLKAFSAILSDSGIKPKIRREVEELQKIALENSGDVEKTRLAAMKAESSEIEPTEA